MAGASSHPGLAFPKGPSRAQEKARAHRLEVAIIKATHDAVWERSLGLCEICGDSEAETAVKAWPFLHQMHEEPSRAATRGKPPAERFNTRICIRACPPCHAACTARMVRPLPLTATGFDGPYDVQLRTPDREWATAYTVDRGGVKP